MASSDKTPPPSTAAAAEDNATLLEKELRAARTRQEMLLAAGEVGTWEYDVLSNTVTSDRNLAGMFNISEQQAVEATPLEHYLQAIHPDDLAPVQEAIQRGVDSGERFEAEYRLVAPDGGIRWVVARGVIVRDAAGRATRLPGVVVDITAQRQAEAEQRATYSRWKLALDATGLGTWNLDPAARELRTDERLRLIFHGSTAPLSFDGTFDCVHPEDLDRVRAAFEDAMHPAVSRPYAEEFRVVHPDGTVRWVLSVGRATFEGAGERRRMTSFDGTVSDITARKQVEDERRKAADELAVLAAKLSEADRRKDEFLATLAHELRNPLAPICTGLELLEMSAGEPQALEKIRSMMEEQTRQLSRLIDDLMDLSRITSGKISLRQETMDVATAVRSAVEATGATMQEAGQHFHLALPERPVNVDGDAARISQIVSNLLTNASRYSQRGADISLTLEAAAGEAVIRVRDTGMGIDPGMLEKIFEMFTQASRITFRSQGGLGIGLTLVRRLTELHGGTVTATSPGEGQGSEFIVRLPLATEAAAPVPVKETPQQATSADGMKILVVDDNESAAEMLMLVFTGRGHRVRVAHDGRECLDIARDFHPDVVFMDIGMPVMDGIEATRHLRGEEWGRDIYIAALTGWGQESDRRRTREAGCDIHLVKPVDPARLYEVLGEVAAR